MRRLSSAIASYSSLFVVRKLQVDSVSAARRQLQTDLAARVTHHNITQQITQTAAVLRQTRVTPHHELFLEFSRAFQLARLEYSDQIVEFI